MVTYPEVTLARFIERDNRFVASCDIDGTVEKVHVKNTGRCKELLLPGCEVALSYQGTAKRKTAYDLIAVKKKEMWVNIDSQVPNQLAAEAITSGDIRLPGLDGQVVEVKREVTYGASRFDIQITTDTGTVAVVEVKGMTLEAAGIGAFPDAPSIRALKHVNELIALQEEGIQTYLLFIAQFSPVKLGTVHQERQPDLATAIAEGMATGMTVLVYSCDVNAQTIAVQKAVPFDLTHPFKEKETEELLC